MARMRAVPTSDDLTLAVHEHAGDGPPALLCHATGFHGVVWEPVVTAIGGRLRCVAPDFRAHGASVVPEGARLEWHGVADDVHAVIDALDLPAGQLLGVGHSMGGAALVLAELQRPGTFRGLWLFEPVIFPSTAASAVDRAPVGGNPLAEGARRRRAEFPSRAAAIENFASKPPFNRLRADALHAYVRHGFVDQPDGSVRLACLPENEARTYEFGSSHGAWDRLGEISCPVVVACGDDDFGPALVAPQLAERIPCARLDHVPSVGHFAPLEAPDAIAARILAFAAGLG
jgi:pimeloyl-ACP methyl ester carboxylesterase